jgi:cytochrome c-type biogenesis protein
VRAATFAFGAGLLAPVNPCGFAMLPAFIGYYLGSDEGDAEGPDRPLVNRVAQGLAVGGLVGGGFAAVMIGAGLAITAGLRPLTRAVPWAAVLVGVALAVLGIWLLAGREVSLPLAERFRPRSGRGLGPMLVFGVAYAVASLSCTVAVLLAVVAQSLATATPLQAGIALGAYGVGSATLITVLSLSVALARGALARRVGRVRRALPRLTGALLAVSGLYLAAYWLPTLVGSRRNVPLRDVAAEASARLTALVDANRGLLAVMSLVFVATVVVLARIRAGGAPVEGQGGRRQGSTIES